MPREFTPGLGISVPPETRYAGSTDKRLDHPIAL